VLSKNPSVIGLTNPTTPRLVLWNGVAFIGPTAKTTTFSESNASADAGTCSATSLTARPFPPRNRRASSGASSSRSLSPLSRATWRI